MNKVQQKRLLNVARALRESKDPKAFTMAWFCKQECGTPQCALGHYAARRDLQRVVKLWAYSWTDGNGVAHVMYDLTYNDGTPAGYNQDFILDHFGLTDDESYELFGSYGCGDAQTPKEAAKYIERFVARKERAR